MADFGDEEYKVMVCVEAGSVTEPITLAAAGVWTGAQGFSIRILDQQAAAAAKAAAKSSPAASLSPSAAL
jgi:D-hexose-6-phosphate mutarotase